MEPRKVDPKLFATARDVEVDWVALRKSAFEAPDMKAFLEQQAPPFPQYGELRKKLAEYRAIAAKGGWPSIPAGETLKPDMEDPRVTMVRKRLAVTGDLASGNTDSALFNAALEEAVKRFQKRHNLTPDGAVGKQTLAAMNVPVASRIEQIVLNMERCRWLKRTLMGERLVVVNIAGFEAVAGKPGKFDVRMPVIVGKKYHDTPAHGLFKKEQRAFSHGCIRMGRPAEMAAWVLGGAEKGWSLARVNEVIAGGKRQVVVLDQPLPFLINRFLHEN
jgi:murein L,D-transpeptidase YcbB/YkuD